MTSRLNPVQRELYVSHLVGNRKLLSRMQKRTGDSKKGRGRCRSCTYDEAPEASLPVRQPQPPAAGAQLCHPGRRHRCDVRSRNHGEMSPGMSPVAVERPSRRRPQPRRAEADPDASASREIMLGPKGVLGGSPDVTPKVDGGLRHANVFRFVVAGLSILTCKFGLT